MSNKIIIPLSVLLLLGSLFFWVVSIYNGEVKLSNRYDAQYNIIETTLDNMRKDLINKFKVTRQFADDFIKVAASQSQGRQGGALFKSNRESESLGISPSVYQSMMCSIEGKLDEFKRSQDTLTDIWREHKTYCQLMPNSIFVGNKIKPRPEMISSEISKDAIKTKKLHDNIFDK